jgi:hypothetical protein
MLVIRLPQKAEAMFVALAKSSGLSHSELACEAITNYLQNLEIEAKSKREWEDFLANEEKRIS